jgi:serine protease
MFRTPRETPAKTLAALASALAATFASMTAVAGAEIALRFYDDNPAARQAALSTAAQSAIESTAGLSLVAKGRDVDGAFRFGFAVEPSTAEIRNALNRLRATGALVYADIASDDAGMRAKHYAPIATAPVTSLIVRMKPTKAGADAKAGVTRLRSLPLSRTRALSDGSQLLTFETPLSPSAAAVAMQELAADPDVALVEPDRRAYTQASPSDPMFVSQWNLNDPVGGIGAPQAWDFTTGDPAAPVAILDSGFLPHPDLAGRVVGGYDFMTDPRFANDGDGRDPDPSDPGDFVTQAEATTPGSALFGCRVQNSSWHGTMVAGTLGAAVNNGSGVSGVNWRNPILNVRVLGKCGGALSDIAEGIRWAAGLPVPGVPANPRPARVINLSLAGPGACGAILQSAVTDAIANGAVVVAAAGNDNDDVANHWPANCNGVIAVAATSKDGSRAYYSNYGARIAISAPGGGNGGSIPVLHNTGTTSPNGAGYNYWQQIGSSLAAPHVAGIASLALAMDPNLSPAEVRWLIESNARAFPAVGSEACSAATCGAGIADAARTVAFLAPNGPTSSTPPGSGKKAPPELPRPNPPPEARIPSPTLAPVAGGWQAKSEADLALRK